MLLILQSKLLHLAALLLAAFLPLSLILGPVNLYLFVGSLLFTVSGALVLAYWPAMKLALKLTIEDFNTTDLLTLALILIFFATGLRELYTTFYRQFFPLMVDRPDEFYIPLALSRYVALIGGILALAARNDKRSGVLYKIPGWPWATVSVIIGTVLGVVLLIFRPH